MIQKIFFGLVLLFFAVSFSDCSVQKRTYRNGYHIAWANKAHVVVKTQTSEVVMVAPIKMEEIETEIVKSNDHKSLTVSRDNNLSSDLFEKTDRTGIDSKDSCGDVMLLKNGDRISIKVVEVDRLKIKYKRCDNLDGPLFIMHKGSIAMLEYANGMKENLEIEEDLKVKQSSASIPLVKRNNGLGLASFIFALLGLLLGITLALSVPFAIGSLSQFKKEPNKYKNKWMPTAALITSLIIALLLTLIFCFFYIFWGYGLGLTIYFGILAIVSAIGLITYN